MSEKTKHIGGGENQSILIKMFHGLGDVIQFTSVLRHISKYRPGWIVDVISDIGKCSAIHGLCNRVMTRGHESVGFHYNRIISLSWDENYCRYLDRPNTKITKCLAEVFKIDYDWSLGGYKILPSATNRDRAIEYFNRIGVREVSGRFPVVLVHYQGNTSPWKKNLSDQQAKLICDFLLLRGLTPVILDWDNRSPLIDQKTVFSPSVRDRLWGEIGTGCASTIAELVRLSVAYVGIDSGPGKAASATDTPTWICWTGHHPFQFHDPSYNTKHILSNEPIPPSEVPQIKNLFEKNYQHSYYGSESKLVDTLIRSFMERFEPIHSASRPAEFFEIQPKFFIRKKFYDEDACIWRDVVIDDCYQIPSLPFDGANVLVVDVGACFGAFAFAWHQKNPKSKIVCVEPSKNNWELLEKNVGEFAEIVKGAVWYGPPVFLADSMSGRVVRSTGGSWLIESESQIDVLPNSEEYGITRERVDVFTLESILRSSGNKKIDYLKMDCESSEYSILASNSIMHRIGCVFGEYHDCDRWDVFHRNVFHESCWSYSGRDVNLTNGLFFAESKMQVNMSEEFSEIIHNVCSNFDDEMKLDILKSANAYQDVFDMVRSGLTSIIEIGDCRATGLAVACSVLASSNSTSRCVCLGKVDFFHERFKGNNWNTLSLAVKGVNHFPLTDIAFISCEGLPSFAEAIQAVIASVPKVCVAIGIDELDEFCQKRDFVLKSGILRDYDLEEFCQGVKGRSFIKLVRKNTVIPVSGRFASISPGKKNLSLADVELAKGYLVQNNFEGVSFTAEISTVLGFSACLPWIKKSKMAAVSSLLPKEGDFSSELRREDFSFPDSIKSELSRITDGSLKNCFYHFSSKKIDSGPLEVSRIRQAGFRVVLASVSDEDRDALRANLSRFDDALSPGSTWDPGRYVYFLSRCDLVVTDCEDLARLSKILGVRSCVENFN